EEALADFERAVAAHPFGARQAQIQLLNQVATLVTLGQVDRARAAARDLTGPFATYIQLLLATATDDWVGADSVAAATAGAPSARGAAGGACGGCPSRSALASATGPPCSRPAWRREPAVGRMWSRRSDPPLPAASTTARCSTG